MFALICNAHHIVINISAKIRIVCIITIHKRINYTPNVDKK